MKKHERAAQIWPLLALCANKRQTLTYELLGKLIGVPRQGLGQLLEPIQSYCILKKLPPLTSLVVGERTGMPGEGFIGASDLPLAQARVFGADWKSCPEPSSLEEAILKLPSIGCSLMALEEAASRLAPEA